MSEALRGRQPKKIVVPNAQELRNKDEPVRANYPPSVNVKLEPLPVSKEVIMRLIKFIEQI